MMHPKKRIYRRVTNFSVAQVKKAIAGGNVAVLRLAAFAVPWHWNDWKAAQEFCMHLSNYEDEIVRGNALLGLSYLARFHKHLDKKLANAILMRGLKDSSLSVRQRAEDAISDVNYLMKWKIGKKDAS